MLVHRLKGFSPAVSVSVGRSSLISTISVLELRGGSSRQPRSVAQPLLWWEIGADGGARALGVVVFLNPRPRRVNPEQGGAGTAGTGMQRGSPAARGGKGGSQRCAKTEKKKPFPK